MINTITLTAEDWAEIYYALESKSRALREGRYAPEDAPSTDRRWVVHLDAISRKIGIDGTNAARHGTSRSR
jgi:hypothetical protein